MHLLWYSCHGCHSFTLAQILIKHKQGRQAKKRKQRSIEAPPMPPFSLPCVLCRILLSLMYFSSFFPFFSFHSPSLHSFTSPSPSLCPSPFPLPSLWLLLSSSSTYYILLYHCIKFKLWLLSSSFSLCYYIVSPALLPVSPVLPLVSPGLLLLLLPNVEAFNISSQPWQLLNNFNVSNIKVWLSWLLYHLLFDLVLTIDFYRNFWSQVLLFLPITVHNTYDYNIAYSKEQ